MIVESTTLNKSKWDLDIRGDDLDTTHFECLGTDQGTIGIVGIDFNIGGNWDSETNNFSDPPGLYPRDNLGAVQLYENVTDAIFWNLTPCNRVLSSKNGAEVRGLVTLESSLKINGSGYSLPTGTA